MSIHQSRDLAGTSVVIVGASSGVGRATAVELAGLGANLTLGARRIGHLDELVTTLGKDRNVAVGCDITQPGDCARLVDIAQQRYGRVDSIVVSSGRGMYGGILDNSDSELAAMIDTNFAGTVWAVRAAVPAMLERGGDIVIISSVAGLRGGANEAVYAGTKFAQVGLAGSIDRELRQHGIRVSLIAPAAISTEFAIGHGRASGDPWLDEVLTAEDVASQVSIVLQQPRRMRTQLWSSWSMVEQG